MKAFMNLKNPARINGNTWTQNTLHLVDRGAWIKYENINDGVTKLGISTMGPTDEENGITVSAMGDMRLVTDGLLYAVHTLSVNLAELKKRIANGMTEADRQTTNVPMDLFHQFLREYETATQRNFEIGDRVKAKFNSWQRGVIEKILTQCAIYVRLEDGSRQKFTKSMLEHY